MKALLFAAFLLILQLNVAKAQPSEKIETDRAGKAQTPFVVPTQIFQLETGFEFEKQDENQQGIQHPELLMRFGLFKRLELRTRILTATEKFKQPSYSQSGLQPVEVGIKALITEGRGLLPHTSFTAQFGIPGLASKDFQADKVFPRLRLNLEHYLTKRIKVEYNLAAEWNGFEAKPTWMIIISPHLEIGDEWEVFVEVFNDIQNEQKPRTSFDAGVMHWISKNVMLDLTAGVGISKEAPQTFIDGGISFRLR